MPEFCEDPGVIQVFFIVKRILDIVKIAVPIGLIIMVMMDFARGVMADEKASKEVTGKAVKRIVAAVIIFFLPFVINLIIEIINTALKDNAGKDYRVNLTDCWVSATSTNVNTLNTCFQDHPGDRDYCICLMKNQDTWWNCNNVNDEYEYPYRVEYYYNNQIDGTKTYWDRAPLGKVINTYPDKPIDGYKFDHAEGLGLTISETLSNNVIRVYYFSGSGGKY